MTDSPAIPNVFHFVWGLKPQDEPLHLMYYLCLASCLAVNRPDRICFHYHHEPWGEWWDRIRPSLTLCRIDPERSIRDYRYSEAAIQPYHYAHLADFARLRILIEEGGIYADMDSLFVRPIPPEWSAHQCILGRERAPAVAAGAGSLCNAWIGARRGSAFCKLWLDQMDAAFDGSWSNHSTLLPWRLSQAHPELVTVMPERAFYALDWTRRSISDLFQRDVDLPQDCYSLHLWNHLWAAEDRWDFSAFHAGRLTPDYVAFADTTYARLARAYLPADVPVSRDAYREQRRAAIRRHPFRSLTAWARG